MIDDIRRPPAKPTTIRVEVTADDIFAGLAKMGHSCPIALATTRAIGGRLSVYVQRGAVIVSHRVMVADHPQIREFVDAFDDGLPVEPFAFDLPLPAGIGGRP